MSLGMKSIRTSLQWIGMLAVCLSVEGCATKHEAAPAVTPAVVAPLDRPSGRGALVYVYRLKKRLGWSSPYPIHDGGAVIGQLRAGEYFSYEAAPGEHSFTATPDGSQPKRIELEAKRTYYLRVDEEEDFYSTPPHLALVDPERAPAAMERLTRVNATTQ